MMIPAEADVLQYAIEVATSAHAGQYRKFTGEPYIVHPLRVMLALGDRSAPVQVAAVLHDTVEDTDLDLPLVRREFGDEVATLVDALTRREGEGYREFIRRVRSAGPEAVAIKVADIEDNMSNLLAGSLKTRYREGLETLRGRPMAEGPSA